VLCGAGGFGLGWGGDVRCGLVRGGEGR
jgi:hypothetical protein